MTFQEYKAWVTANYHNSALGLGNLAMFSAARNYVETFPEEQREAEWQAFNKDWHVVDHFVVPVQKRIEEERIDIQSWG